MREPDLDPAVEALVRDVMGAVDDLRTARMRLENLDIQSMLNEPTEVTAEFMSILAASEGASPALQAYAERVRNGECHWRDIELLARPIPPEIADLKNSPQFVWNWNPEPSDAGDRHDDFDAEPPNGSWLD
ncbi:hypothetical protein [Nocardia huaxiensis]|uniref:hypothetical protein n=1 Tax=Nocardia huaxiensis TaxID=2755382 RepID=UPI001E48767B|nr:hypothetical protein [Nocardia huaxiensis]UFS95472.1 hypothetical protein LPY97_33150 [Nocardia huaxiensis]